ncbi:restriction endonuclease subunit S [Photobacterium sp. WH24]|uniref:restriction endonuclease subunit S n=1 Tax=Photobacterium sp. WH24 TaxID=2827237 RepID=UPI001C45EC97|nr:restriction endonuclease subunit S [Photobacterium sp. WH24]MBV7260450.1 restriction endonuclease subunit S [Photobacterium sp. WH24]
MGKYQAYTEYTASNAAWLDEYPSHWRLTQVKYGYQVVLGKMLQKSPKSSADSLKPYLKAQNIQPKGVDISRVDSMWFSPEELHKLRLQKGDVLVSEGGDVGRSAIWNDELAECYIQNAINRIRPLSQNCSRYFNYWIGNLKSSDFINILCNKATIAHYTAEKLEASPLLLPSSIEQTQIANFLDHETAKIDTLIEKQQQLIKLLKEKRQAVISHAVTKGLNPQAPMKDSGVEWLGEVPKHWDVKPLRYLGMCQNGINIGAEFFGSGYPFVSYGDAYRNYSLPTSVAGLVRSTEKDRDAYSLLRGDVLFTRTSETIEEIGLSSACLESIPEATFAGFLIRFRPTELTLHPEFSKFSFRNQLTRAFFVKEMNLVTRASLSQELLKKLPVPLPPLEEQVKIAEFLCSQEARFQSLFDNAENAVQLLKERRTALISAAVTGKIDVRNWQAPDVQHAASVHETPLEAMA